MPTRTVAMRLFINIDHVATVRQARRTDEPDPVRAAVLAELGGADGITVHLREDRRHIQDRDVALLRGTVRTPLNLESSVSDEMVGLAVGWLPHQVTLVPERREEITTEGGLDLSTEKSRSRVAGALTRLRDAGIRTSVFIDPEEDGIRASVDLGVDAVELHTGEYANARGEEKREQLARLDRGASLARKLSISVHAGHGLTYENVTPVAAIPELEELNIGHSVVSRAVLTGMESAVREMARVVRRARGPR